MTLLLTHKTPRRKAFSLIELIIVIAVIAAITGVIVPSISNLGSMGKNASDERNIQVWNVTFMHLKSLDGDVADWVVEPDLEQPFVGDEAGHNTVIDEIKGSYTLAGQEVSFSAPSFTLQGTLEVIFDAETGLAVKTDS